MKQGISKIHFPTALGLLILLVAIVAAVVAVRTRTGVKVGADETTTPKSVRVTNVLGSEFSVSWVTDKATTGVIKYGVETGQLGLTALDDRDQLSGDAGLFGVHHITVKNLAVSTKYYFKIESDSKQLEVTTGPALGSPPAADPVYGKILTPSQTAAEGVVVYLNVANAAPLSALAKTNGNWALNLSTARSTDLLSYLDYDTQATIVNLLVQGGSLGTAPAITTTTNDSPVPDITLGKSHDFRTVEDVSNLQAETEGDEEVGSGFDLDPVATDSGTATSSGEVTLDNPSFDGEVINATQPAFIGSGTPGMVLAIEVNSESTYTGSSTIDEDGNWEFIPPDGLTAGEHEITVSYIDTEGIEQTLSRTFVIAAAGESEVPAITATPSGEVDPGRTELPATDSGVPEPGTWEVTLMMALTGLGLLISGIKLKNKV